MVGGAVQHRIAALPPATQSCRPPACHPAQTSLHHQHTLTSSSSVVHPSAKVCINKFYEIIGQQPQHKLTSSSSVVRPSATRRSCTSW